MDCRVAINTSLTTRDLVEKLRVCSGSASGRPVDWTGRRRRRRGAGAARAAWKALANSSLDPLENLAWVR